MLFHKAVQGAFICLIGLGASGCRSASETRSFIGTAPVPASPRGVLPGGISAAETARPARSPAGPGRGSSAVNFVDRSYPHARTVEQIETISKADILDWTQRRLHEEVIIDRIVQSRTVFRLTAADEINLRDRGVSESVIRAMRTTGWR